MAQRSKEVDAYIAAAPAASRTMLKKLRTLAHATVPGLEESINYGIPTFKLHNKPVLHIAGWKKHVGVYPPVPKKFAAQARAYTGPKGNMQLPLGEPLPTTLLVNIMKARAQEYSKGV